MPNNFHASISSRFGPTHTSTIYRLRRTEEKLARANNDLTFLIRCRNQGIIPKGLRLYLPLQTTETNALKARTERALVRIAITETRRNRRRLLAQVDGLKHDLQGTTAAADFSFALGLVEQEKTKTDNETKARQIRKFEGLLNEKSNRRRDDECLDSQKVVRNLSTHSLTESERDVLALGLNFGIAPKAVPVVDIIAAVESAANELPEEKALELRTGVKKCLQNAKKPKSNLGKEQREALRKLREDDSIVILPADKGNATVVMNKEDYARKMEEILNGDDYEVVKTNPTSKLEKKLNNMLRGLWEAGEINKIGYDRLRATYSATPQLYGLPKIHKPEVPLRPIVSSIDSPTYNLAKFLTRIISPLTGKTSTFVKDSGDFVEKARSIRLEEGSILVSFDVTSLFTKVPIAEALEVIGRRLEEQEAEERNTTLSVASIKRLLHLCLTSTYFMWNSRFYQQKEGAAMGNPLSPVVANIYMEHFEALAIESARLKPATWLRYVDDTFVVWNEGMDKLHDFLEHLNTIRPSIQFTMELEEDGKLPFLDVLVTRGANRLTTKVYRKATHTDRYIHFTSNHHNRVKRGNHQMLEVESNKDL